ncbi:hypothetical protein VE00_08643 [Pseudogymnoascus sp. WSF 3629]|nr:hypothetical protein VE00_08643 [Pseudogymnoascus sp. WSF 3629]
MRCREFWILASVLTSLIFSILLLTAGSDGMLNDVTLATLTYNTNMSVTNLPYTVNAPYRNALWWLFSAHYLSLCGGYAGGAAVPDYVLVGCTSKPLGWTVRGDDPFIVGFHAVNGSSIMKGGPFVATDFSTAKPAGLLVAGMAVTVLAAGGLLAGAFSAVGQGGRRQPRLRDWGVAGLIALATTFLIASAAIATPIAKRYAVTEGGRNDAFVPSPTSNFLGLSWGAVGFMLVALGGEMAKVVRAGKKRRMALRDQGRSRS